ncbi:MAG: diphthamide biosynthesis enzyme Dph2 [Thaumarchaeota archaeon]|nr:MAG: diphthamide biosynthesis enzyme Dph2 [Nitrososphaerota archaeon]
MTSSRRAKVLSWLLGLDLIGESVLIEGYEVDVEGVKKWIRENEVKRVLVQAPPGLRGVRRKLIDEISGELDMVFVHGGGCWGGCDLAVAHAKAVGADAIIHLGHARFLEKSPIPTFYLECRKTDPAPILAALEKSAKILQGHHKIGVGVTIQWQDSLSPVRKKLEEYGVEALTGPPIPPLRYEGQVLGCGYEPLLRLGEEVECYLIIGSKFHGLGLALQTEKTVYSLDPELQRLDDLSAEVEKLLRSRYGYIEMFRKADEVGVVVSVKPGQYRMGAAVKLRETLRKAGKRAEILIMDDVEVNLLRDSGFEGFVNMACPRLSIEDQQALDKPLLLPMEALIAVGAAEWGEVIRTPRYFLMEV